MISSAAPLVSSSQPMIEMNVARTKVRRPMMLEARDRALSPPQLQVQVAFIVARGYMSFSPAVASEVVILQRGDERRQSLTAVMFCIGVGG